MYATDPVSTLESDTRPKSEQPHSDTDVNGHVSFPAGETVPESRCVVHQPDLHHN